MEAGIIPFSHSPLYLTMTNEHNVSPADEKDISTAPDAAEETPEEGLTPDDAAADWGDAPVDMSVEAAAAEAPASTTLELTPEPEPEPGAKGGPEPGNQAQARDSIDEPVASDETSGEPVAEAAAPDEKPERSRPDSKSDPAPAKVVPQPPRPERAEVTALRAAQEEEAVVEGKIIGWNNGGLHVVVNGVTAFCPRSEIELGAPKGPEAYVDKTLPFLVLRVQKRGRRIVLSRKALLQGDRDEKLDTLRSAMRAGEVLEGKVSSVTDFGAFVDLGGLDGLIHVSEISRTRVEHASEALSEGDSVKVRVLKISDDGSRVSLSAKALEPDPWDGIENRFPAGDVVKGTVERTAEFGAFVEIAPGLTGLLGGDASLLLLKVLRSKQRERTSSRTRVARARLRTALVLSRRHSRRPKRGLETPGA
jgi:predicted RNA-binding protein with RPS1 domain